MRKIRVLVIEDSLTVRKRLVEALSEDPECSVIAEAADGQEGIELCQRLRPDVVTLDMMLPKVNGLAATEHIMAYCPTPIVIVSASFNRGELFKTYDALAAGAVDVLDKPHINGAEDWDRKLCATVKLASRIKVITHVRGRLRPMLATPAGATPIAPQVTTSGGRYKLIAVGASTGGPAAVIEIFRNVPRSFPVPVLLVMHIGKPFGMGFADWLGKQVALPVTQATDAEPLPRPGKGRIIMAPPDQHLVVHEGRLRLTSAPERHSCRPSVDVLFESLAREVGSGVIGCLLTGMGRDGAEGLLQMKRAGAATLVQDEATSIVFGMPREAVRLGAADRILPIGEFEQALSALVRSS